MNLTANYHPRLVPMSSPLGLHPSMPPDALMAPMSAAASTSVPVELTGPRIAGMKIQKPRKLCSEKDGLADSNLDKKFRCPQCNKLFVRNYNLTRHVRIHNNSKEFECAECGKKFTEKHHLVAHVRSHTGERPFFCPKCHKLFTDRSNMLRHARSHGEDVFALARRTPSVPTTTHQLDRAFVSTQPIVLDTSNGARSTHFPPDDDMHQSYCPRAAYSQVVDQSVARMSVPLRERIALPLPAAPPTHTGSLGSSSYDYLEPASGSSSHDYLEQIHHSSHSF